jgi:hypothetical protein
MVKQKTLPPSRADSTQIRPPYSATIRLQIERPMPVPA